MTRDVEVTDRRRWVRWTVEAAALVIVGTAIFGAVRLHSSDSADEATTGPVPPRPTASSSAPGGSEPRGAGRVAEPDEPTAPAGSSSAVERSVPVHLTVPAIGVSADLLRLGLRKDRTVEVPAPSQAEYPGWYELGTLPGQVGSAVILGHVDSTTGPAVFYELRSLEPGDLVDVRLDDGAVAHFAVEDVLSYLNEDFPARKVYTSHGYRALNLVTCGGEYDEARGGYQSNVVVYTRWTSTTPAA